MGRSSHGSLGSGAGTIVCAAHKHKMAVALMVSAAFSGAESRTGKGSGTASLGQDLHEVVNRLVA